MVSTPDFGSAAEGVSGFTGDKIYSKLDIYKIGSQLI